MTENTESPALGVPTAGFGVLSPASVSVMASFDAHYSARSGILEIKPCSVRRNVEMDHFRFATPIVTLDPGHSSLGSHDDGGECPGIQPRNRVIGHGDECPNPERQDCWPVNPASMLSMLPTCRANQCNFFSAGRIDVTHQQRTQEKKSGAWPRPDEQQKPGVVINASVVFRDLRLTSGSLNRVDARARAAD